MKAKNGILKGEIKSGKLIKCCLEVENNRIKNIKFTGDFFIYPEEKIEELEEKLRGVEIGNISKVIYDLFKDVEIVGASKEDFVKIVEQLIKI